MKRSYLEVIAKLRAAVGTTKVMLMNSLGYSSLSMMPSYDGTFSEGRAINAVGLLGAGGMVNIMWTANNMECCPDEPQADVFFQRRLYMGVYPMAPLPAADHCIGCETRYSLCCRRVADLTSIPLQTTARSFHGTPTTGLCSSP